MSRKSLPSNPNHFEITEEEKHMLAQAYYVPQVESNIPSEYRTAVFKQFQKVVQRYWLSPPGLFDKLFNKMDMRIGILQSLRYSPCYSHLVSREDSLELLKNRYEAEQNMNSTIGQICEKSTDTMGLLVQAVIFYLIGTRIKNEALMYGSLGAMTIFNASVLGFKIQVYTRSSPQVDRILANYKFDDPKVVDSYATLAKHLRTLRPSSELFDNPQEIPAVLQPLLDELEIKLGINPPKGGPFRA